MSVYTWEVISPGAARGEITCINKQLEQHWEPDSQCCLCFNFKEKALSLWMFV